MAIYVCVINVPKSAAVGSSEASCWQAAVSENPVKPPPPVCLLRRITIGELHSLFEDFELNFLILSVK